MYKIFDFKNLMLFSTFVSSAILKQIWLLNNKTHTEKSNKNSIYHLILFLFCISINMVESTNYYFSSSTGNDSRTSVQAQSKLTPWQSITKLNSSMSSFLPGDSVLFNRGEVFYGSITITKSGSASLPIVFAAYGVGAKPEISGLKIGRAHV